MIRSVMRMNVPRTIRMDVLMGMRPRIRSGRLTQVDSRAGLQIDRRGVYRVVAAADLAHQATSFTSIDFMFSSSPAIWASRRDPHRHAARKLGTVNSAAQ